MEQVIHYIKPELLSLTLVLYFIGVEIKKIDSIPNKYIPLILGGVGILLSALYVLSTCPLTTFKEIMSAIFTALVQGILVAGLSNYVNQIIKQLKQD